jgi:hypothetical protein
MASIVASGLPTVFGNAQTSSGVITNAQCFNLRLSGEQIANASGNVLWDTADLDNCPLSTTGHGIIYNNSSKTLFIQLNGTISWKPMHPSVAGTIRIIYIYLSDSQNPPESLLAHVTDPPLGVSGYQLTQNISASFPLPPGGQFITRYWSDPAASNNAVIYGGYGTRLNILCFSNAVNT